MPRIKIYFGLFLLVFTGSCFPPGLTEHGVGLKMPLGQQGEVLIYLQPLPQEANNLRFVIGAISTMRDDGLEISLTLSVENLKGADLTGHQKLLASGILPPGSYTGISIQVKQAFVQTADGEMALLVAEEPLGVDLRFNVVRGEATTLFLSLNPSAIITAGIRFTPVFSLLPPGRMLINLTGLVSNFESNNIAVFNKMTMQIANTIATGAGPTGLVLDQLRGRAYLAASREDELAVIDVFKMQIVNRLKLNFRDNPVWLALTPDQRLLVSVNHDSNSVSIVDALSMIEIERIRVGEGPTSAVIDPPGLKAYVMNSRARTISVVDLTQRRPVATIGVEGAPLRGVFNQEGDKFFVISDNSPYLSVIDRSRLIVAEKIFVGLGAVSIRVDDQTGLIYVGKDFAREIAVIDPLRSMFVDMFPVGGKPVFMTIDGQERTLLVTLSDRSVLQKINLISKKIIAEIEVGQSPYAVVVMGER